MKIIYTKIAELSFIEDELILNIKILEDAVMNFENTKAHYEAIKELTSNRKYLALVDATNSFKIEAESLTYASLPEVVSNRIAAAHYNSSESNTFITNVFKANYQPPIPIQIFRTKNEAVAWLKSVYKSAVQAK